MGNMDEEIVVRKVLVGEEWPGIYDLGYVVEEIVAGEIVVEKIVAG